MTNLSFWRAPIPAYARAAGYLPPIFWYLVTRAPRSGVTERFCASAAFMYLLFFGTALADAFLNAAREPVRCIVDLIC